MQAADIEKLVRSCFDAYATKDRVAIEALLADDFHFTSPLDNRIDRKTYFEVCWPNAGNGNAFDFPRVIESGDEVVVTYEATRADGTRFRNTEVLTFAGDKVRRAEVYFGWEL